MKFIIVTFFTEGPPYDHGENNIATEHEFQKNVKEHADRYIAFSPRKLASMDPIFEKYCEDYTPWLEQHPDRHQLGNYNPGWAKIGFFMWKSQLILHVLNSEEVETGDIVLYHDVNCLKYPKYILNCEEWRDLSLKILNKLKCDIFIPCERPLKKDVKACLIRKYLGEHYFEKVGVWTGLVLIRKSKIALQFLSEWARMSSQLENVSPLPNPDPHPECQWHCVDQSVVSILAWRWRSNGSLAMDWPRYQVRDRHFSRAKLKRGINSKGTLPFKLPWKKSLVKVKHFVSKMLGFST